ncbi:MAG TPA: aminotransferase [Methylococcaceae bacterium]|nr:aminotransferase [Methylococcaceae bacterium]
MTINSLTPEYSSDIAAMEQQLTQLANQMFSELPNCDGSRLGLVENAATPAGIPADLPKALHQFATPNVSSFAPPQSLASFQSVPVPQPFDIPADADLQKLVAAQSVAGVTPQSLSSARAPIPSEFNLPQEAQIQKLITPRRLPLDVSNLSSPSSSFYFLNEVKTFEQPQSLYTPQIHHSAFDIHAVRRDFPILNEHVNGHQLVWFDNAATTQKPQVVIDRISYFYEHENSNIHRAAHELAARSTDAYEKARQTVAKFINAPSPDNIIFVRGTTEAINLIAKSWGLQNIKAGDEIVITWLEHHANIVPWQQLCEVTGAVLRVTPVDDSGQVLLDEYQKLLNAKTKLVSFTQVSNALGTITPAHEMIVLAHRVGAKVLLDAAQSVSHISANVQSLDCDWLVFSGHKIFAPTGIGVVYGKSDLLEATQPWQGGGNMIEDVTFEHTRYQPAPAKFEAGTGNIADAVGLGAALDYVQKIGIQNIAIYEHDLLAYAMEALRRIDGLTLIGTAKEKTSVLSFVLKGYTTFEVGEALNKVGIAVRSGHHCAQPILRRFGLEATVRPSLAFYNTHDEVDHLVSTVRKIKSGRIF